MGLPGELDDPPRAFSLNDGGPFHRWMRRLGLLTPAGMVRSWWLALFAWVPIVVGNAVRTSMGASVDPMLLDLSVHIRLLVTLPLLLFSERLVEAACRSTIHSLYEGRLCDREAIDRVVHRGERLRDAWWPEAAIVILGLGVGQLALWRVTGASGVFHGETAVGSWSFPHIWYVGIALPLMQFVMLRWLWRWAIWGYMLWLLAALPLRLIATHPDRAAGLGCLSRPMSGFAGFACATSAVLAGAWGTQILNQVTTFKALSGELLTFLLVVLAIAVAPLLFFSGHLYKARRRGLAQYGDFAVHYMRGFHEKWLGHDLNAKQSLGSPDIQSLADLGGAFDVITKTRLFVFGLRSVLMVWTGAIVPMLPFLFAAVTPEAVLKRIVGTVLGGMPL